MDIVAVLGKSEDKIRVERSPKEDTMIGMWEFAGGKVEEPDEFNADGTPDEKGLLD